METMLITGGAGFIGKRLARVVQDSGLQVIVLDNSASVSFDRPMAVFSGEAPQIFVEGDIRDSGLLNEIFQKYRPSLVVHLAAIADANAASLSPDECRSINVDGVGAVLRMMDPLVVRRFVFVSSSYVYGDFHYEPADEKHPLNPQHIYGITKLKGEELSGEHCRNNGIDYTIVRPTSVYGYGSALNRVCCKMIMDAFNKHEIVIHDDGSQRFDFTYIEDLVDGFLKVLQCDEAKNQAFNLSRGRARSIGELAELVRLNVPGTKIVRQASGFKKPARGALDISRARMMLGFSPGVDLEEGIPLLIKDLQRNGVLG